MVPSRDGAGLGWCWIGVVLDWDCLEPEYCWVGVVWFRMLLERKIGVRDTKNHADAWFLLEIVRFR